MSEELDADDRTEDASERRLDEARKEGRVPLSRDAVQAASMLLGAGALFAAAPALATALVHAMRAAFAELGQPEPSLAEVGAAVARPTALGLSVIAAGVVACIIATLTQTRGGFWLNLLAPKAERFFSVEKITHVFTKDGAIDLGVAALKACALFGVGALALLPALRDLVGALFAPPTTLLEASFAPLAKALPRLLLAIFALAALDVVLVRARYFKRLRMSKDELKREHKEDEGDPHIRGKRRRKHKEMAQGRVAVEVPRADAIVVNPTHIAVAIRYRKKTDRAPRVTAKGKGRQAEIIRELAAQHGIPIVRDVSLARFMHKRVKVGREVPAETFRAVAAVLATVYRLTGRPPGTGAD